MTDQTSDNDSGVNSDHLHDLCETWAYWRRSRGMFGSPRLAGAVLGKLSSKSPVRVTDGRDSFCSPEVYAFNLAVLAQPEDVARMVFEAHYLLRVKNIKCAADEFGIGRRHWYRLLAEFRVTAHAASLRILEANRAALAALPSRVLTPEQAD
jgi:hypothetical protein